MTLKSSLLRSTIIGGTVGLTFGLALTIGTGSARAQIATTGNVAPVATAPFGGSFQTDKDITIGTGGGAGTLNFNRITVNTGLLRVDEAVGPISPGQFDGARIHVGTDLGEGSLLVQNGSSLVIDNTGAAGRIDGAGLQISNVIDTNGTPALEGRVDIIDSAASITSDDGTAFINVGRDGVGTLNVTNSLVAIQGNNGSAALTLGGPGTAPSPQAGAQGTATFDNSGLMINSDSTTGGFAILNVGRHATGTVSTLNVINGSTVVVQNDDAPQQTSINIGRSGTTGVMNVDASSVTVGDFLNVGRDGGTGTLNLTNGATVDNTAGLGLSRTGRGGGNGEINVRSGATLNTNLMHIGRDASGSGTVTVADTGSTLNVSDTILVGRSGSGTLNIGDGPGSTTGVVNAHTAVVGTNFGSTGEVNLSGAGALMNLTGTAPSASIPGATDGAVLLVGSRGTGTVNVTDGANITISPGAPTGGGFGGGLQIGGSATSPTGTGNGTVNIDGTGSVLALNGAFGQIGRDGTGVLNVTNGGSFVSTASNVDVIGRKATGDGTVNVTGAGSTWTSNRIHVGTDTNVVTAALTGAGGTATLNVANGGSVTANEILVAGQGRLTGGGGTITGDVTIGNAAMGGGMLAAGNSPGLMSVSGNLDLLGGSTMEIELGGTVFDSGIPQFDYDRVDVTDNALTAAAEGTVTIETGTIFDIDFFGAFTAGLGDTFDVLVADDIDSDSLTSLIFDFTGAALATGLDWDIGIVAFGTNREALQLSVVAGQVEVPAPGIAILFSLGVAGLALVRRRRAGISTGPLTSR
tara:strand:+ start:499 stop:2916 length:2418 start_codon:yes stop_codon:yes gene_type:complete